MEALRHRNARPNTGAGRQGRGCKSAAPGQISRDVPAKTTGETPLDYSNIAQRNQYNIDNSEGSLGFTFRRNDDDEDIGTDDEEESNKEGQMMDADAEDIYTLVRRLERDQRVAFALIAPMDKKLEASITL